MVNVINNGYIDNVSSGIIVELPTYIDEFGLHPQKIGKLPDAIAAILSFNTLFKHQRASITIGSSSIMMQITFGSDTLSPSILIPVIALKALILIFPYPAQDTMNDGTKKNTINKIDNRRIIFFT